jgi:hypothetical protein
MKLRHWRNSLLFKTCHGTAVVNSSDWKSWNFLWVYGPDWSFFCYANIIRIKTLFFIMCKWSNFIIPIYTLHQSLKHHITIFIISKKELNATVTKHVKYSTCFLLSLKRSFSGIFSCIFCLSIRAFKSSIPYLGRTVRIFHLSFQGIGNMSHELGRNLRD